MSGKVFFDTNVLIYPLCRADARTMVAEKLLARGGVVGVQVLNEFVSAARRKFAMSWADVLDALGAIRVLCGEPTALDDATHRRAVDIGSRHGLSIYDALIGSAALAARCDTLLTEDMQHGRIFEGTLTLENPFKSS